MMKKQLENRLQSLRQEYDAGQRMLADLDAKRADLQQTLLRISGAVQVLEEMLAEPVQANGTAPTAEPVMDLDPVNT